MTTTKKRWMLATALFGVWSEPGYSGPPTGSETFPPGGQIQLDGVLGQALSVNQAGRLRHLVVDESSWPIRLFAPENAERNHEGDWYGEHAGKWLYAAARAAARTGDQVLAGRVRRAADYLVAQQGPDGYLGTYAVENRFTRREALGKPTWDVWVESYLILGLLETNRYFSNPKYVACASRIGDLCWRTLHDRGFNITDLGNHCGLSATVLLEPAVELYFTTHEQEFLDLAKLVLAQANARPDLELLPQMLAGTDVAAIGDGKAYQLCWMFLGVVKLYEATGDPEYLRAVQRVWTNIIHYHLTLGGGPWGGVAIRSTESFNSWRAFSPYGYVETCSTLSWIQLNRELLDLTGEAKYAEEIEKSAYNDLLGAQDPNGEDWCYYSYPNGKRTNTFYWACCKSSGAMALEELPPVAYRLKDGRGIAVNLYGPSRANLPTPWAGRVSLEQITGYPFEGAVRIVVRPERPARYAIFLRIPAWSGRARIQINRADSAAPALPGAYAVLEREWQLNDEITLRLPMIPTVQRRSNGFLQKSKGPDGTLAGQQVTRYDYLAVTRGPLVYATGLIDGFKPEETIRLPENPADSPLELIAAPGGCQGPAVRLNLGYRPPLSFLPYYEADGRKNGSWRVTWLRVAAPAQ